jgi:flagellar biosynthesis protein
MNYYFKNKRQTTETAVALGFDPKVDSAPRILATGKGVLAQKILEIADQEEIPIHKDENLVDILSMLEQNNLIPIAAYAAVAKILSQIYKFDKAKQNA